MNDDLISRSALLADLREKGFLPAIVQRAIERAPAADVEPLVRCKDCKHYKPQKKSAHWENRTNYCNRVVTIKVQPHDFCSYGERKEGAD